MSSTAPLPSSDGPHEAGSPPRPAAADHAALFASLYTELHRIARREVHRQGGAAAPVSPTTLLHEAYLDLSRRDQLAFSDQAHFLAYAGRAMRGLVIDRVRARHAQRRGGGLEITSLDTDIAESCSQPEQLEALGDALDELAALEPELATVVDLKFFAGFSVAEVAKLQGLGERTVQRRWEKARLLLYRALGGAAAG